MDTGQYKDLFISEAREILSGFNKRVVDLERRPDDVECLNDIFRKAHTLKGMSAMMGYEEMTRLTHEMESVLDLLRIGKLKADKETIDLLLESSDALDSLVSGIASRDKAVKGAKKEKGFEDLGVSELIKKLENIKSSQPKEKRVDFREKRSNLRLEDSDRLEIVKARQDGFITYRMVVSLSEGCVFKKPRALIVVKVLEELGNVVRSQFVCKQLESCKFGRHFGLFFTTKESPEVIREKIEAISEIDKVIMRELEIGEVILDRRPETRDRRPEKSAREEQKKETQMTRVSLDKLDNLMNVVGELVINKIRLYNIGGALENKLLSEALAQMGRLTDELQIGMMDVRLVPMEYIFNRFPRMIRDLSAEEKKNVDLVMEGAEIGLDRMMLDEINEPLVHLLRNAVNHGIETSTEREKLGKKPVGTVGLSARRERNFVIIEVSDDGAGIDIEEIKKVAVDKRIITSGEASNLSDEDALALIAEAGFSTSKEITQTSGRGVGMNAVRTKVESFNGSLTIESLRNRGSKFILKLPLTMAIIHALLVRIEDETCAIPLINILEVLKINSASIKIMEHHEVISYRDTVLPLIRLTEKLGFNRPENGKTIVRESLSVVVVETGSKKAGLIVDKLSGQQEVVIKTLKGSIKNTKGIAGATILGDGRVAMILDVASVV